jgi:hypothetical protein
VTYRSRTFCMLQLAKAACCLLLLAGASDRVGSAPVLGCGCEAGGGSCGAAVSAWALTPGGQTVYARGKLIVYQTPSIRGQTSHTSCGRRRRRVQPLERRQLRVQRTFPGVDVGLMRRDGRELLPPRVGWVRVSDRCTPCGGRGKDSDHVEARHATACGGGDVRFCRYRFNSKAAWFGIH